MIQPEMAYLPFLDRATHGLAASGAQSLDIQALSRRGPAGWTEGWDRMVLFDSPGSATLYAFADGSSLTAAVLRDRINRLARGLADLGMLQGIPLRLVSVAVYPNGVSDSQVRAVTAITPEFLPGLRPTTWAVDLRAHRLCRGRSRAEGAQAIESAVQDVVHGELVDANGIAVLQQENMRRTQAFYQLMRGRTPIVTYALVTANVFVFALMYIHGAPQSDSTLRDFGALSPQLIESGQWWRLFTAIFLHAGIPHIVFNMTSLFVLGTLAERLYGSSRFLGIYLGAGLAGSLASFGYSILTGDVNVLGVGASGAIFGIAGALLTLGFQHSDVIPAGLRRRLSTSLLPLVVLNLLVAYVTPHVDNSAHVGGLLGGALLSFLLPVTRTLGAAR